MHDMSLESEAELRPPDAAYYGRRYRFSLIWLVFLLIPLQAALASHDHAIAKVAVVASACAFSGVYVWLIIFRRGRRFKPREAIAIVAVLMSIAATLTVADRPDWAVLFIFVAGAAASLTIKPITYYGVLIDVGACALCILLGGGDAGTVIGYTTSAAGVGMLMLAVSDLRAMNEQLHKARSELAQLAVARERERFARDLHDLLGHSLSVISLKAELAGRLLPERAPEAAAHVAEIEKVARGALTEVREAVSGYRKPTLDGELAGARMALSAAGIRAVFERPNVKLDPEVEAVLAWAVREGATNVLRHSGATTCTVKLVPGLQSTELLVIDDGAGKADSASGGHGIAGLSERVQRLHGLVEAGVLLEGGFRLRVSVPVANA
jgi:two-component system sensor histidine kinase DesK